MRRHIVRANFACWMLLAGCAERVAPNDAPPLDGRDAEDVASPDLAPTPDIPLDDAPDAHADAAAELRFDAGDVALDPPDRDEPPLDRVSADVGLDLAGDLPRVVLPMEKTSMCNDLYVHTVIPVTTHTEAPPWPLRRGSIPPGYYVLVGADNYPERDEDGGFPIASSALSYTLRVRPDSAVIQIASASRIGGGVSSLYRRSCEFNPRASEPYYFCPVTCIHRLMGLPGVPGFREYEVVGDIMRIQVGTYLLTLQRVGPP